MITETSYIGKNTLTSVIIPTYNRAHKLKRAIDSVICQTFKHWELLIIDDGSTDNTQDFIERNYRMDFRIRFMANKYQKGPGGARNFGIDNALGKYLAFLDSDDEWLPDHLQECILILEKEDVKLCCGLWNEDSNGSITINKRKKEELDQTVKELSPNKTDECYLFNKDYCEYVLIRGSFLIKTSTVVIDKSIISIIGKFDHKLLTNQDLDFFIRIIFSFNIAISKNIQSICYQGIDNLHSFNGLHITGKQKTNRILYHRKFAIKFFIKCKKLVSKSSSFRYKYLLLRNINCFVYLIYYELCSINAYNHIPKYIWYRCYAFYYFLKFRSYSDKGNAFFYLSFSPRFTGLISKYALPGIRYRALQNKILNKKERISSYWLYIEDFVYDFFKKDSLLLYNKANEKVLVNKEIGSSLNQLIKNNKLLIRDADLLNLKMYKFIRSLYKNCMGGLINNNALPSTVLFSVNRSSPSDDESSLLEAFKIIRPEITFYLNDICDKSCNVCNKACMQVDFCMARQTATQLSVNVVKKTILDVMKINRPVVNINGGDLLKYTDLKELCDFFKINSIPVRYYIHCLNLISLDEVSFLQQLELLNILISFPIDTVIIKRLMDKLSTFEKKYRIIFLTEGDKHTREVNKLCKNFDENIWDMVPFYNGHNERFFNKRVFVSEKDILSSIKSYELPINKRINKNNHGRLYVLPQGDVYTNLNEKQIGNIYSRSVTEILENVTLGNTSWKWLRSDVQPCKECIYDLFCPSITNFEISRKNHKICNKTYNNFRKKTTDDKECYQ